MGQRVMIGFLKEDESVDAIYCHWGSPDDVGVILDKFYTDPEDVKTLISYGGVSTIEETLEETLEESYAYKDKEEIEYKTFRSIDAFVKHYNDDVCFEYLYIFSNGSWKVMSISPWADSKIANKWVSIDTFNRFENGEEVDFSEEPKVEFPYKSTNGQYLVHFAGHYKSGTSDKIWGVIETGNKKYSFWGRRGKKPSFKLFNNESWIKKINEKKTEGYIGVFDMTQIYPDFWNIIDDSILVAMLSNKIR